MANAMVKLPGGCYLAERTDDVKKLNVRQLNVIPFQKYRLDPVVEEADDEEYDWLAEHPVLESLADVALPVIITIVIVIGGCFL